MPLRDDILNPIPGDNPSGVYLNYDPLYITLKELRKLDTSGGGDDLWAPREKRSADFKKVAKLTADTLATKSKDLQLAAWLTEALTYEEGFAGLKQGLEVCRGLVENFWDTIYPEIDDGDVELRAAPLEWMGNYFEPSKGSSPTMAAGSVSLTKEGHNYFSYQESRRKKDKDDDREPFTAEMFDTAVNATPKNFYKNVYTGLTGSITSIKSLGELCDQKFGRDGPSFRTLQKYLEELENIVRNVLKDKFAREPEEGWQAFIGEEVPEAAVAEAGPEGDGGEPGTTGAAGGNAAAWMEQAGDVTGLEPKSRAEALVRIAAAAHYLRKQDPTSPVSYMVLRAMRWGQIRAVEGEVAPELLTAPPPEARLQLKSLASASRWVELIEYAENLAASECGRGWLDVHRYVIRACEEAGRSAVARALKSELRAFLRDYETLIATSMTDDSGTANPETLKWLRSELDIS